MGCFMVFSLCRDISQRETCCFRRSAKLEALCAYLILSSSFLNLKTKMAPERERKSFLFSFWCPAPSTPEQSCIKLQLDFARVLRCTLFSVGNSPCGQLLLALCQNLIHTVGIQLGNKLVNQFVHIGRATHKQN